MPTHIISLARVLLLALLLSGCAHQAQPPVRPDAAIDRDHHYAKQQLTWYIEREIKKHRLVGLSIAIVDDQKTLWTQGFGFSDKQNLLPASPNTRYRAGSVSKLFNAIALMQLVERGKLDLDTPLQHYLPEFSVKSRFGNLDGITARTILTHHSGLPSDLIKSMWSDNPGTFHDVSNYLKQSYVSYPANAVFSYSNIGHSVLGILIERLSGQRYEDYLKSEILAPLKMPNSEFSSSLQGSLAAKHYEKSKAQHDLKLRDVPAGGLNTTVKDLATFLKAINANLEHDNKFLISKDSQAQMYRNQLDNMSINLGQKMGLGWFYFDGIFNDADPVIGHNGATLYHRALLQKSQRSELGVALLSNSKNAGPSLRRIAKQAFRLFYEAKYQRTAPRPKVEQPTASTFDINDEQLLGHYATIAGLGHISRRGDTYYAKVFGRKFSFYQKEDSGLFYLKYKLWGLIPINLGYVGRLGFALRKVDNRELLVAHNTLGQTILIGEKIYAKTISDAWKSRAGKYQIENPLEAIDVPKGGLSLKDGFLVANAKTEDGTPLEFVLFPKNDNEAVIAGLGRGLGETVHVVREQEREYLKYSDIIFSKLK